MGKKKKYTLFPYSFVFKFTLYLENNVRIYANEHQMKSFCMYLATIFLVAFLLGYFIHCVPHIHLLLFARGTPLSRVTALLCVWSNLGRKEQTYLASVAA